MREQRLGVDAGDARDAGECGLRGRKPGFALGPLSIRGEIPKANLCPTYRQSLEPESGILRTRRADDAHPQVHHCNADTADRGGGQRAVVEVLSLDQQVREASNLTDSSELRPERSAEQRRVKSPDRLPLHDCAVADLIVSRPQAAGLEGQTEFPEKTWHAARWFTCVHDNGALHGHTFANRPQPIHHSRVPIQHQLALSRSESA